MTSCTALSNAITDAHGALLASASESSGVSALQVASVLAELGGEAVRDHHDFISTLNNNGSPLQLCHSLDSQGMTRLKLIVDPHAYMLPGNERLRLTLATLEGVVGQRRSSACFSRAVQKLNQCFLPGVDGDNYRIKHRGGYVWLASDMHRKGLAIYYSPRHCADDPWSALMDSITELGIAPSKIAWLSSLKRMGATLASVAIQEAKGQSELKVYWRMTAKNSLSAQPHALFTHPLLLESLGQLYPEQGVANHGLLFSQSIDLSSGTVTGVKIDLCGHCLRYDEAQWMNRLLQLPSGVLSQNAQGFFKDHKHFCNAGLDIAFVSLGIDTYGKSRCNLYWKIV